jgi:hypothetical protein
MKNIFIHSITILMLVCGFTTTNAWIYPEHRDIALVAIQNLSPEYRGILDNLWTEARMGFELRLTEAVIDATQSTNPTQLDFASWPAIAGDHSCSAKNMLQNSLETEWILKVADITAQLKIDIANAKNRGERINALRESDLNLQSADPDYATRAGSNNAHFLLPLANVYTNLQSYLYQCLSEGTELNALGIYTWYHSRALAKISKINSGGFTTKERSKLILSALADEAFALHFLEDIFAAGHVAGTRGHASERKGTHDYYNEYGLKVSTWEGESMVLTGDAWMRLEDSEKAAIAVRMSLEDFLRVASNNSGYESLLNGFNLQAPEDYNVCTNNYMPAIKTGTMFIESMIPIFMKTPIPGLSQGLGEFPRFRAEVGTFVGFSPSIRGYLINGGFGQAQETTGAVGGIEVAARFGVGLDGVLNESGDGLLFLAAGWRQDGSSTTGVVDDAQIQNYGNLLAAIPGRSAFNVRLRLPFYLLPGDLIILGPMLFFIDEEALVNVGVSAVNGGLIPWQAGIETSFGRFQFVLGREISVYQFGRTKERDALFNISKDENGTERLYVLSYRSTQFEFPFLEYRPISSFEVAQRSSLLIQFYGGFDVPNNVEVLEGPIEGGSTPELKTVWYLGARLIFDWRHYF